MTRRIRGLCRWRPHRGARSRGLFDLAEPRPYTAKSAVSVVCSATHLNLLPPRSLVGLATLTRSIGVRIPGGQPILSHHRNHLLTGCKVSWLAVFQRAILTHLAGMQALSGISTAEASVSLVNRQFPIFEKSSKVGDSDTPVRYLNRGRLPPQASVSPAYRQARFSRMPGRPTENSGLNRLPEIRTTENN